jgi:hypothetical protein
LDLFHAGPPKIDISKFWIPCAQAALHHRAAVRNHIGKLLRGKFRQVSWFVYALTALFVLRFVYLAQG